MKTYSFTIVLDLSAAEDELADRLFDAGCDDATCGQQAGEVFADFDRQANDLESAVASAVSNVKQAGYSIRQVRFSPASVDLLMVH